jgi:hypothetical protein
MRGLNGLILLPACGHAIPGCAVDSVNRAFVALRSDVFRHARALADG